MEKRELKSLGSCCACDSWKENMEEWFVEKLCNKALSIFSKEHSKKGTVSEYSKDIANICKSHQVTDINGWPKAANVLRKIKNFDSIRVEYELDEFENLNDIFSLIKIGLRESGEMDTVRITYTVNHMSTTSVVTVKERYIIQPKDFESFLILFDKIVGEVHEFFINEELPKILALNKRIELGLKVLKNDLQNAAIEHSVDAMLLYKDGKRQIRFYLGYIHNPALEGNVRIEEFESQGFRDTIITITKTAIKGWDFHSKLLRRVQ